MRVRKQIPTPSEERDSLRELRLHTGKLYRLLSDLPPRSRAALRSGDQFGMDLARISADQLLLAGYVGQVETELAVTPARSGRKRATRRDDLLKAIVKQLRASNVGIRESRKLATDILALCEIAAPRDERALRRTAGSRGA
jgi:hypothetical protein